MNSFNSRCQLLVLLTLFTLTACQNDIEIDFSGPTGQWQTVGGNLKGIQFSNISQINTTNIEKLQPAWEYKFPHYQGADADSILTQFQLQAIITNNTVYGCSATSDVVALDPTTGEQRWFYQNPTVNNEVPGFPIKCRGVAYWQEAQTDSAEQSCNKKIFVPTSEPALVAIDADTGQLCDDFGNKGKVKLGENIGGDIHSGYGPTSAPTVANDLVIVGSRINDNIDLNIASGVVRAYDARNGELRWAWNPVHPDKQPASIDAKGNKIYTSGTVNSWAPMSADIEHGLLFVPTGNPSPDLYGGDPQRDDFYGSSVVALELKTGKVRWHFQTVHHDIWDYDVPSIPALFQHPDIGSGKLALAQPTKNGNIFLLDRLTGEPLYAVEERPVPQGGVPGEILSKTQPFPTHPQNLHPLELRPWGFTPWDKNQCKKIMEQYRWDGPFTPPSLQGSLLYPGNSGGMNWGSASIDPKRGILLINQSHFAWVVKLIKREDMENYDAGEFNLLNSLFPMKGSDYGAIRFPLTSPLGAPCSQTPWGSITAVDLISGKVLWSKPLGSTRDLAPIPLGLNLGTPNFGGVISTAGGVAFATGTLDKTLRGFDIESGDLLWEHRIDGLSWAPPMTYRLQNSDLQYIVFSIAGSRENNSHDKLVAFTLKQ